MTRKIWVVNHGGHNISSAIRDYRPLEVVYLSEGSPRLDSVDRIAYHMAEQFKEKGFSHETDAVLLCGNIVLNFTIASVLWGHLKVPYITLLIWDGTKRLYFQKVLDVGGLEKVSIPS